MKKLTLLFIAVFAFTFSNNTDAQQRATAHVENGSGDPQSGRMYRINAGGASRDGNGNSNNSFGNIADWVVDLTIAEQNPQVDNVRGGGTRMQHDGFGALGWGSFAAGVYGRAYGAGAVAVGFHTIAGSQTGIGPNNNSDGNYDNHGQVAMGFRTRAVAHASTAMGQETNAEGDHSFAIGYGTTTTAQGGVAVGRHNATTNAAFVIGNGADAGNQSDAFIVNTDGSAVFSGDVTVNSDMRLKANIISLGSTMAKLLQIDGKSYVMKKNTSEQKIGLLAQDVQAVYPELVKEANNEEGTLSVNYQGLIPVLINAIKEQQAEIDELKKMIHKN
ncbi:trimeric autotransporter adhesin [Flavobacteriaceae bacterium MAR_2010_72]|nr:trimeric autotransporter adhesin [Flavobacteriaceae bacterium MAR_2010_72]